MFEGRQVRLARAAQLLRLNDADGAEFTRQILSYNKGRSLLVRLVALFHHTQVLLCVSHLWRLIRACRYMPR